MAISDRMVGKFPLSIASSLALESLTNTHEEIVHKYPPLNDFESIYINIRTIYRNIVGALDKETHLSVMPKALFNTLLEEMEMIQGIIRDFTEDKVNVYFYFSNYKDLEKHYKYAILRMDNTPKQLEATALANNTYKLLMDYISKEPIPNFYGFDLLFKPVGITKSLVMTNYALDLLAYKDFKELVLIESHTGKLKSKNMWYSKYYSNKEMDLSRIPFTDYFIRIFGDDTLFRPFNITTRKNIVEIANKYNWNVLTTRDKIVYGINTLQNEFEKRIILDMIY